MMSESKAQPNVTMLSHYVQQTPSTVSKYFDIRQEAQSLQ